MNTPPPTPNAAPSTGIRQLLLGMLAVAIAFTALSWFTRPEAPPPAIDGIEVTLTDDNFRQEVLEHRGFVLVDFWFEDCPPCRRMKPVVAHLSVNYRDRVKVGKMDIDQHAAVPTEYGLDAFPVLLLFRDGKLVARRDGYAGLEEMSQWLDEQLSAAPVPEPESPPAA